MTKLPIKKIANIDYFSQQFLDLKYVIESFFQFKQNNLNSTVPIENDFSHGLFKQKEDISSRTTISRYYRVLLMETGEMDLYRNENKITLSHGDLAIIPALSLYHENYLTDEMVSYYIIDYFFETQEEDLKYKQLFNLENISIYHKVIPEYFWETLNGSYSRFLNKYNGSYFQVVMFLFQVHNFLLTQLDKNKVAVNLKESLKYTNQEKMIYLCINYVDDHMDELVSINKLCELCDCSQSYLYQCFDHVTGFSSKEFLMRYKMLNVENDLANTKASIEEIALRYGFSSIYSFSAVFKKMYNLSPMKFRQYYKK